MVLLKNRVVLKKVENEDVFRIHLLINFALGTIKNYQINSRS